MINENTGDQRPINIPPPPTPQIPPPPNDTIEKAEKPIMPR